MNPLGIAMAFVVLWAMIGLGIFLIATAGVRMTNETTRLGAVAHAVVNPRARARNDTVINVALLISGLVLAVLGGNGIYTVIYH